jgi:hypothetical protein
MPSGGDDKISFNFSGEKMSRRFGRPVKDEKNSFAITAHYSRNMWGTSATLSTFKQQLQFADHINKQQINQMKGIN